MYITVKKKKAVLFYICKCYQYFSERYCYGIGMKRYLNNHVRIFHMSIPRINVAIDHTVQLKMSLIEEPNVFIPFVVFFSIL